MKFFTILAFIFVTHTSSQASISYKIEGTVKAINYKSIVVEDSNGNSFEIPKSVASKSSGQANFKQGDSFSLGANKAEFTSYLKKRSKVNRHLKIKTLK